MPPLTARQARVDTARKKFEPKLKELLGLFDAIPDILPYYNDETSRLEQAINLYGELSGAPEHARATAWLAKAFGSIEHVIISERGRRLREAVEALHEVVDNMAEAGSTTHQFDLIDEWVDALGAAATQLEAQHFKKTREAASSGPPAVSVTPAAPRTVAAKAPPAASAAAAADTQHSAGQGTRRAVPAAVPVQIQSGMSGAVRAVKVVPAASSTSPAQTKRESASVTATRASPSVAHALVLDSPQLLGMRGARQMKLSDFRRTTLEEQRKREAADQPTREAARVAHVAAEKERALLRKERAREAGRDRQRAFRARRKEASDTKATEAESEAESKEFLTALQTGKDTFFPDAETAAASTHRATKKTGKTVALSKPKRRKATWARRALFPYYEMAARKVGFQSPTNIVRQLQRNDVTGIFANLDPDTLRKWIGPNENGILGWTADFRLRVQRDGANVRAGRKKFLDRWPEVFKSAIAQLRVTRAAHAAISLPIVRAIFLAHIRRSGNAELLAQKISNQWLRDVLHEELHWSFRTSTRAAQKIPPDAEKLTKQLHARLHFAVKVLGIKHPALLVNPDQAGFLLLPGGHKTWAEKGSKQVDVHGHDEKRQMTMVVASSCNGDMLPFQTVWGGVIDSSLPSRSAERWNEADELGFKHTHGDTRHWSSCASTKEWVTTILLPYHARVCEEHGFSSEETMVLLLDVWSVHTASKSEDDFLPWLKRTYPWIIPLFIPGGCTGIFQPADVGLQRLVKHVFKTSASDWVIGNITRQLAAGTLATHVTLPTALGDLRDASISWAIDAYRYMADRPELVRQAWAKCKTGDLDLSWESISSAAGTANLSEQLKDPQFSAQFSETIVPMPEGITDVQELHGANLEYDDDMELSADQVARTVLGGEVVADCVILDNGIELHEIVRDTALENAVTADVPDSSDFESSASRTTDFDVEDKNDEGDWEIRPLRLTTRPYKRSFKSDGNDVESDGDGFPSLDSDDFPNIDIDYDSFGFANDGETDTDDMRDIWDGASDVAPPSSDDMGMSCPSSPRESTDAEMDIEEEELSSSPIPASVQGIAEPTATSHAAAPQLHAANSFALDIAVIGTTNFGALRPPLTDAERREAIKAFTAHTTIPKKARKKASKNAPGTAQGKEFGSVRKRGRPSKASTTSSATATTATGSTGVTSSAAPARSVPKRKVKPTWFYEEINDESGPAGEEDDASTISTPAGASEPRRSKRLRHV